MKINPQFNFIAIAIVTGFQKEIRAKVIGFGAHIQINKYDNNHSFESSPISNKESYLNEIKKVPGVVHWQNIASKAGIVKSGDAIEGIVFKGLDKDYQFGFFEKNLINSSDIKSSKNYF